jgi:TRAP-type transport system periplasmic protein
VKKIKILVVQIGLLLGCSLGLADAAASDGKSYEISFGHVMPIDHPEHLAAVRFADTLNEKTDGRISVNVFPSSQLGGSRELMTSVMNGTIQIASTSTFGTVNEELLIVELPYLFTDFEHINRFVDSNSSEKLLSKLDDSRVHGMGFWPVGFRNIGNNQRVVRSPKDLDGLLIRAFENKMLTDTLDALGANVTVLPYPEVYMALQTGTVDGEENPYVNTYAMNFYEVEKYKTETRHIANFEIVAANLNWWNSLSQNDQDVIEESFDEATEYYIELQQRADEKYKRLLTEYGMEITEVEDREEWVKAVQPVYEKWSKVFDQELVDTIRNL